MKANWKKLCKKQREEIAYLRGCVEEALSMAENESLARIDAECNRVIAQGLFDPLWESQSKNQATERDRKEVEG